MRPTLYAGQELGAAGSSSTRGMNLGDRGRHHGSICTDFVRRPNGGRGTVYTRSHPDGTSR